MESEHTEPSSGRQLEPLLQDGMELQPGGEQPLALPDSPVTSGNKGLTKDDSTANPEVAATITHSVGPVTSP